jgi:uncharacterized heparinase superfamily protein
MLTRLFPFISPSPAPTKIERIAIAPQDLRTADPTVATDIYSGYFAFAGRVVSTNGESPFSVSAPSRAWSEELMGFGWLRDLRAADTALARANARTLVDDWINTHGKSARGIAWDTSIVSRRVISWLCHSPIILDGADRNFYRRFMLSIGKQAGWLWSDLYRIEARAHRLQSLIALAFTALCTDAGHRQIQRVSGLLVEALNEQILADGGHISRNPQLLIDILADLLPLRQSYISQGHAPPQDLLNAIDRIMPMVRLFRHGDGSLGLFNGMSATAPDLVATLLAYQDSPRPLPIENAPHSGYRRMQADSTVVVMDAGAPPPEDFSLQAHAGCLSFELSDANERIVINCGAPTPGQESKRMLARATAAHSTVTINEQSSCTFAPRDDSRWPFGGPVLSGPKSVRVQRSRDDESERIDAAHDGYLQNFGLIHGRSITLGQGGNWIIGEDSFVIDRKTGITLGHVFAIRFHLHPNVEILPRSDGQSVRLYLPSRKTWMFACEGGELRIDESIMFASPNGLRKTRQLIIEGLCSSSQGVKWTFVREDATAPY